MFALLFPGYSLVPYFGDPFCCVLIPYLVGMWSTTQPAQHSVAQRSAAQGEDTDGADHQNKMGQHVNFWTSAAHLFPLSQVL